MLPDMIAVVVIYIAFWNVLTISICEAVSEFVTWISPINPFLKLIDESVTV